MDITMKKFEIEGQQLAYLDKGEGPVLLLDIAICGIAKCGRLKLKF